MSIDECLKKCDEDVTCKSVDYGTDPSRGSTDSKALGACWPNNRAKFL